VLPGGIIMKKGPTKSRNHIHWYCTEVNTHDTLYYNASDRSDKSMI